MNKLSDEDIKSAYLTGAFASADDWTVVGKYVTEFAHAIIAAHEAQRQAVQEPTEYQARTAACWRTDEGRWSPWAKCSAASAADYERTPTLNDWEYQVRRLYTAPQPAPVQAALAYHAALNETLNDTNVQLREDVAGYQAALAEKNAEIAALKEQLASLARGVKISIPTDTMEQEFQVHYRRGVASQAAEIAALRKDALRYRRIRNGPHSDNYGDLYAMTFQGDGDIPVKGQDLDRVVDAAIAQAVQA